MANINATDNQGLLYFLQKLKQIFVTKELKAGTSTPKVLSDNNLSDQLVNKINAAGTSNFSGSYADLTSKPSIGGVTLDGSKTLADIGVASVASVPTKTSQLTNDAGFAKTSDVAKTVSDGDATTLSQAKSYADGKVAGIAIPSRVSQLTNDSAYQTSQQVVTSVSNAVGSVKTELEASIAASVSSTFKPAGSIAFASLPSLSAANLGKVYNVTDAFTTTTNFVEGAGAAYPKNTNVVCVNISGSTYKWDVLAGMVDLSGYLPRSEITTVTNAQIDAMFA